MMGLGRLKQEADALAAAGARLAMERDAHARSSIALAGEALSSPGALAVLFAAGFVVASPRAGPRPASEHEAEDDQDGGRIGRWLAGPVGTIALRVASGFLSGAAAPVRGIPPVN